MKVAILTRERDPLSLRHYRENIVRELNRLGVLILPFSPKGSLPNRCDLIWDPGLGSRPIPRILAAGTCPVLVTVHGLGVLLRTTEEDRSSTLRQRWRRRVNRIRLLYDWRWLRRNLAAVICVSDFCADETMRVLDLPSALVRRVYHGVDFGIFKPEGKRKASQRPYMLHVSGNNRMKNVQRMLAAYAQLPEDRRPDFVLIRPGCENNRRDISHMRLIDSPLSQATLAEWYRGAMAFVLPSLRETFGMPILEAMACGCPVITSNNSGCSEVAGEAALLVDPRSIDEIAEAMQQLVDDDAKRQALRSRGLARARKFSWQESAQEHAKVFRDVVEQTQQPTIHGSPLL